MSDRCPICNSLTNSNELTLDMNYHVSCMRCGNYFIDDLVIINLHPPLTESEIAVFSGWIKENRNCLIDRELFDRLKKLPIPTVGDKADKFFKFIVNNNPISGKNISLNLTFLSQVLDDNHKDNSPTEFFTKAKTALPWLSVSWTQSMGELKYILNDYLCDEKGYLSKGNGTYKITPKGWAYWDSLQYVNPDSQIAFMAMWFDPSMDAISSVFEESILRAGYKPVRVDRTEHLNDITDEVLSLIRRSKLIVADFTGQRGGVYYEAGYALGLGLRVIWLCHEDDKVNLHFDTEHNNYIFWNETEPEELLRKLQYRIEKNFGKGKYSPKKQ